MGSLKILLVCNLFGEGSTALCVAQALSNIGHSVIFCNFQIYRDKPQTEDYDMAIVWTGRPISKEFFGNHPYCFVYLDDPEFWAVENPEYHIDKLCAEHKVVITNMKWEGYDSNKYHWIPMGTLKEIYQPLGLSKEESEYFGSDVVFVGTDRGKRREFIKEFRKKLNPKYNLRVWGNGWEGFTKTRPAYFYDFARVMSASKIVITEHWKNAFSTNDCEKPSCAGALTITDSLTVKQEYPTMPYYSNVDEAAQHCHYYLEHEEERKRLVIELARVAHKNFTYEKQLSKIINLTMGESIHPLQ